MAAYWLLILMPALLSLQTGLRGKWRLYSLWAVGLFYLTFVGLRYEVGADRVAYAYMFQLIAQAGSFAGAVTEVTEPGYAALCRVVAEMGGDMNAVNFLVAAIFVSGLVRLAGLMPSPWLALVSVTPYLVIAIGMSAVRQSAAIGLVFHLIAERRRGLSRKIALSLLAVAFHYSAVMAFVLVQQGIRMKGWVRGGLLLLGAVAVYPVLNATDTYAKYYATYLESNLLSPGALLHILLNAFPSGIYLLTRRRWQARFGSSNVLPLLVTLSIASVFGVSLSSTGVDRLALYLSPIQMLVFGSLPWLWAKQYRLLVSVLIVSYHLVILFWWLNFANTTQGFLPYDNWLLLWMGA